jgi:hypothetical protein
MRFCRRWAEGRNETTGHHYSTVIFATRGDGNFGFFERGRGWRKGRKVVELCKFSD